MAEGWCRHLKNSSIEAYSAGTNILGVNRRAIDVMKDSGLDPSTEPVAEVLLRALAATWFADRYPKDTDTAALLKESSMSNFGIPRNLWEEAKLIRKLIGKATTETDA